MELGLAIYAAIVGSVALGWEAFKWIYARIEARRPDESGGEDRPTPHTSQSRHGPEYRGAELALGPS
jgi:hypothetical protein